MTKHQQMIMQAVPSVHPHDAPDLEAIMMSIVGDSLDNLPPSKFAEFAADAFGMFMDFTTFVDSGEHFPEMV